MADWTEDYKKHSWQNGEVITADRMNNIQNQLKEISKAVKQASSGNLYASPKDNIVNSSTLSYRIKNMIQYGTNSDKPDAYNKLWIQDTTAQGLPAYLIPTLTEFDDLVKSFVAVFDKTRSYKVGDYVSHSVKLEDSEGQDENNYKIYKCITACGPADWETNSQYFTTTDVQILNDLILNVQKNIESINTTLNNVIESGGSIQYFDYGTLKHGYVNNSNEWRPKPSESEENFKNYLGSDSKTYFEIPSRDITIKTTDVRFRIRLYNNNKQMLNPNKKQLYDGSGNPYIQIMPNNQVTLNLSSYSGQTEDTQVAYFRFYFYHQDGTEATPDEASIILSQTKNLVTTEELENLATKDELENLAAKEDLNTVQERISTSLRKINQQGRLPVILGDYLEGRHINAYTGEPGSSSIGLCAKDFLPIFQQELTLEVLPGTAVYLRFYDENYNIIPALSTGATQKKLNEYNISQTAVPMKMIYGTYQDTEQYGPYTIENPITWVTVTHADKDLPVPKYWKWTTLTIADKTPSINNFKLTYLKNLIVEEDLLERDQDPWAVTSVLTAKINVLANKLDSSADFPDTTYNNMFSTEISDTGAQINAALQEQITNRSINQQQSVNQSTGVPFVFAFVTDSHIDINSYNNIRDYWKDTAQNIKDVNNLIDYTYKYFKVNKTNGDYAKDTDNTYFKILLQNSKYYYYQIDQNNNYNQISDPDKLNKNILTYCKDLNGNYRQIIGNEKFTLTSVRKRGFDAIVHGGDYITRCSNKMDAEYYLTRSAASLDSIGRNFFGVMGNHDGNRQNQQGYENRNKHISKKQFNSLVLAAANIQMAVKKPYELTYYVDFKDSNIDVPGVRMIFVEGIGPDDAYNNLHCSYSTQQMLVDVEQYLKTAPQDYYFILVSHHVATGTILYQGQRGGTFNTYENVLEPYKDRIIMHLNGHYHRDYIGGKDILGFQNVIMAQGVPGQESVTDTKNSYGEYQIKTYLGPTNEHSNVAPFNSTGATWAASRPDDNDNTKFYATRPPRIDSQNNTFPGSIGHDATQSSWSAFVIEPTKKQVRIIRFGAGGRMIDHSSQQDELLNGTPNYLKYYDDPNGLGGDCGFSFGTPYEQGLDDSIKPLRLVIQEQEGNN